MCLVIYLDIKISASYFESLEEAKYKKSMKGTCAVWVTLARREKFDDTGWTILRILSQRPADALAKDFVKLKTGMYIKNCVKIQRF